MAYSATVTTNPNQINNDRVGKVYELAKSLIDPLTTAVNCERDVYTGDIKVTLIYLSNPTYRDEIRIKEYTNDSDALEILGTFIGKAVAYWEGKAYIPTKKKEATKKHKKLSDYTSILSSLSAAGYTAQEVAQLMMAGGIGSSVFKSSDEDVDNSDNNKEEGLGRYESTSR